VLTVDTRIGRRLRPKLMGAGTPLARVKPRDIAAAGIERMPRTVGVRDGLPLLEDGRALEVANVVWCTGFRADLGWIDQPGLYFVGLFFLTSVASSLVGGVGHDAEDVAARIAAPKPAKVAAST
jgi:putative flavoprotein involved in K+ transport